MPAADPSATQTTKTSRFADNMDAPCRVTRQNGIATSASSVCREALVVGVCAAGTTIKATVPRAVLRLKRVEEGASHVWGIVAVGDGVRVREHAITIAALSGIEILTDSAN